VLRRSAPVALSIPAIGVRSAVRRLGQAADGSIEVPAPGPHYDQVGWYRFSPTPGSLGPAVIVGHVDSAANGPSVFWRLGSLHPRDLVRIRRSDGSVAVFAVDDVHRFRKTQFPTHLVYGNTNNAALRLITCGGPIEGGHYRDNIVVRASLVRATA
jgi:sortase (surface protein transpeptidase)